MTRILRGTVIPACLATLLLASGGCDEGTNETQASKPPRRSRKAPAAPVVERAEVAPDAGAAGVAGSSPTIKQIMGKLTKGPQSLTPVIGNELNTDQPPWETIQAQTREYARLVAALKQNDPPKGTKQSWDKRTSDYAKSAEDLDRAAQVKDRDMALAAHSKIASSCMACHREHRTMRPGMGMAPGFGPPG